MFFRYIDFDGRYCVTRLQYTTSDACSVNTPKSPVLEKWGPDLGFLRTSDFNRGHTCSIMFKSGELDGYLMSLSPC